MHREINPPAEILRRLSFVVYLAVIVFFLVTCLLGLVQKRFDYLQFALLGGIAAFLLRFYGKRYLEFDRLAGSFLQGEELNGTDMEVWHEVKRLLAEASTIEDDWQYRQSLRQKLLALLARHPELWQEFHLEIAAVFPALEEWAGKSHPEA